MKIVPSILTDRLEDLRDTLNKAEEFAEYVQIDFMDGVFVPSKSVSPTDLDGIETPLVCEAHLMVKEPGVYLEGLRRFGFRRAIFHLEADSEPEATVRSIREAGMEAGIAINPETDSDCLDALVPRLDAVLFLSVTPGFYGSPFVPTVLEKIRTFREKHASIVVGIDGGVGLDNIPVIRSLGVNYACVGSRIFLNEDPGRSYRTLQERAEG